MTQYAKQGGRLYYGRQSEILPGKYECIGCEYLLETVFKEGEFSHFKHSANSRDAHKIKHGELCTQMSTNFSSTAKDLEKAKKYNESTMKQLLEQARSGDLDPEQVIGHLLVLESLIQNRASVQAEYKVIREKEMNLNRRSEELDDREFDIDRKEYDLHRAEKDFNLYMQKEKNKIRQQEVELHKRALNKALQHELGMNILKKLRDELDLSKCPPWHRQTRLDQKLEEYIWRS